MENKPIRKQQRRGEAALRRTAYMLHQYHQLKKITKIQNGDYAEATDRYNWSMRWYELIREILEEWRETTPNDATIIMEIFGIGTERVPRTVLSAAMRHHYSESTVYKLRKDFITEITITAAARGLLNIK